MKAYRLLLFLAMVLVTTVLMAQFQTQGMISPKPSSESSGLLQTTPDFGLELGSSFATGFGGASMFTQSIAPHVQFRPGQNFALTVGTVFSTANMSGGFSGSPVMQSGDRFMSTTVYALGAYQLNPRVVITGGAWTERNNLNLMNDQMNPQAFDMNAKGMMLGIDYKVTENFRFGAEINVSHGGNPFNMYNQGGFTPMHRRPHW